ncbi:hypothetical protein WME99_12465 [Sorangium sp. So ce136]|uniref:hypothetical protein n=1 Tax=Sorangium sp. So ce136 TaxID=3133284 RepID=UPI003EFBDE33
MLAHDVPTDARLEDLDSTGYVVVRSFLNDAGVTIVHDNDAGGIHGVLPYALDELAVTLQPVHRSSTAFDERT